MNEQQNSTDPLREEFETAISELTPDERAELRAVPDSGIAEAVQS